MHPFNFSKTIAFTCADPASVFEFNPPLGKFHWVGKSLDKLGKYRLEQGAELRMELEYNFAREQTLTVLSTEGAGDALQKFILQCNKTGERYSFSRA